MGVFVFAAVIFLVVMPIGLLLEQLGIIRKDW